MTPEIAMLRQRLSTAQSLIESLIIGIDCDIDEMRAICDKFETKADLKTERMVLLADRIHTQRNLVRKNEALIKDLKKELGEES